MGKRIGIDLGTTNSVVAIEDGPQARVLDVRENRPQMRSVVGLKKRRQNAEILCGDVAYDNWPMAPKDTILSVKRLMGRAVADAEVQQVREWALYEIDEPADGTRDSVCVVMGGKQYSPIAISAMILRKLKEDAEFRLGEPVTHAVVTVPAYFSQIQRDATHKAAAEAGLKVMKILDEPTAAAVSYGIDVENVGEAKYLLVYDLGGGTFDVSLLMWGGNVFAPLKLEGNMWLGGDNFDQLLVEHALRQIRHDYGIDVMNDDAIAPPTRLRFLAALKNAAQAAKERLSSAHSADIIVAGQLTSPDGDLIDVELEVTREHYEQLIRSLVDETVAISKKAVEKAGLTIDQIDYVLMAGNATCTPLVQKAIEGLFGSEKVLRGTHPKHSVALGAAIMAHRWNKVMCPSCRHDNPLEASVCEECGTSLEESQPSGGDDDVVIGGIAPYHYGAQTAGDKFNLYVKGGDPYPTQDRQELTFYTQLADQRMMRVPVYGGNNLDKASENEKQGEALALLPAGLAKGTSVRIKLWLNGNGVFKLTAHLEDGTDLNPTILTGGEDQKAVDVLQKVDDALGKAREEGVATPEQEERIEEARREAFERFRNGDYAGAMNLAKQAGKMIPDRRAEDVRQEAERVINFIEYIIHQYGQWAIDVDEVYRLTNLVEEGKAAVRDGDPATIRSKADELERVIDGLPDIVLLLEGLKQSIHNRIRDRDPVQAVNLLDELEEIEKSLKSGHHSAAERLAGLQDKVDRVIREMEPAGRKCPECQQPFKGSPSHCPNCNWDLRLLRDQLLGSSSGRIRT